MKEKTLPGSMTPKKAKMGTAMSEVTGKGNTSVIHQTSSQAQPARHTIPCSVSPEGGGISLRIRHSSGPAARKASCRQRLDLQEEDMGAPVIRAEKRAEAVRPPP